MQKKFACLLVFALFYLPILNAQTTFPTLVRYSQPSGVSAPGEMFTPPLQGSAATNAPQVGEWTRTAGPDESVILTGSSLSRYSGAEEGKDTRFLVYGTGGTQADAAIQRMDGDKAVITMPPSLSRWGMYLVWPVNDAGMGSPIAVNKTEAWWVGPDKAPAGTTSSVFGRNLANQNGTSLSYVYIKSTTSGAGQWAQVTKVNPYKVDFTIPANLANGDYEVWTHNGHGGEYGWSGPHKLTVSTAVRYSGPTINVKDYGARGDGQSDDLAAINRALAAVRASAGATLYFPAGTYMISGMLEPSSNTRWKGEGMNQTIIKCNNNFRSEHSMVFGRVDNFELSDMTFDGNRNYRGRWHPIYLRAANNLHINNVRMSFLYYNVLDISDGRHVFVNGCELIGKMSLLGSVNQIFIDGCTFRIGNDTDMAIQLAGTKGVSLTNSTCQDYDASNYNDNTGIGKGRFLTGSGNWGSNHYTYIGNNKTIDLGPVEANTDQNSGEQFMWEGNWTNYIGTVASSSSTTTSLNGFSLPGDIVRYIVIIKGKGLGQSRRITAYRGNTITVEEPWNVIPDGSSTVVVGQYINNVVVYGNFLDGKARTVTDRNHTAIAGIEPYGGTLNFVAANNTLQDLRQGTSNWALQEETGIAPNYFSVYTHNTYQNVRWAMHNASDVKTNFGTAIIGTVYRRSTVKSAVESPIHADVNNDREQFIDAAVYEHNTYYNVPTAFSTGWVNHPFEVFGANALKNHVLYKNTFNGNGKTAINLSPKMVLRENQFSGFQNVYHGKHNDAILEVPNRVIYINANENGSMAQESLAIWNSGPVELDWKIKKSSSWLSVSEESGSIKHEGEKAIVQLSVNPRGMNKGVYRETLTVESRGNKIAVTVVLTVGQGNETPPPPPLKVQISAPVANAEFIESEPVNMDAIVDSDEAVDKVEFYINDKKVGEDKTAPYTYTANNLKPGQYEVVAKVIVKGGRNASSETTSFSVVKKQVPLKILLTSPKESHEFDESQPVNIEADIETDEDVEAVEFYINKSKYAEVRTAPFTLVTTDLKAGKYDVAARVITKSGKSANTNLTNFEVKKKATIINVELTSPAPNKDFLESQPVNIAARVDSDEAVDKVEFYINDKKVGEDKTAPYTYTANNLKPGQYEVVAKVIVKGGRNANSQTTSFTVSKKPNKAPSVAITSPKAGNIFDSDANITVTADASDSDGTVDVVRFYSAGQLVGSDRTKPYSVTLTDLRPGSYKLTALAVDNEGAETYAKEVTIQVKEKPTPQTPENCPGTGGLSWEYFYNIPAGAHLSYERSTAYLPSGTKTISSFATPRNFADNYGSRIMGYICPPETGNYTFYLASDDHSELWISSDENPQKIRKIAYVNGWTPFEDYNYLSSQRSTTIYLEAGKRYFVETVHLDGGGDDHLSVAWRLPSGTFQAPIAGKHLVPYEAAYAKSSIAGNQGVNTLSLKVEEKVAATNSLDVAPNPVQSAANLRFSVAESGTTVVELYNAQGSLVKRLFNGTTQNGQTYQVPLDGSSLPNGLYLVRLVSGNTTLQKQVIIAH